jgi:hypothetical protein
VIAGVSGSGTRVFQRVVRHSGRYMGTRLNVSEDALDFYEFADRWIGPYTSSLSRGEMVRDERMRREFLDCVARHRASMEDPARPWGWKQPRSIHLLPFMRAVLPGLKFLHVVRDGRDVAFGEPTSLVLIGGDSILGPDRVNEVIPLRMMRFWDVVNARAADYGERQMGEDYLRVRFEDLCAAPAETIRRILRFANSGDHEPTPAMLAEVVPPRSLGRWRGQDRSLVAAVSEQGTRCLRRFRYLER